VRAFDAKSVAAQLLRPALAHEKRNVPARFYEAGAKISAGGASSNDQEFHLDLSTRKAHPGA
jgi:hypothetical protein